MSRQDTRDLRVSDVDIGMMIARVCCFCDAVHEGDTLGERSEGKCLHESIAPTRPPGQAAEGALNFEIGELGAHGANGSWSRDPTDLKDLRPGRPSLVAERWQQNHPCGTALGTGGAGLLR